MDPLDPLKVFISYSHDSQEHRQRVLELANRLRFDGIDAWVDHYMVPPPEGWARWTEARILDADLVLLICTVTYCRRFEGKEPPGVGRGAVHEGRIVSQILYEAQGKNDKFIPLLPEEEPETSVPLSLRQYMRYRYPSGYEDLYGHLTGQPEVVPPPLGKLRARSARPTETAEVSREIVRPARRVLVVDDEEKWRRLLSDILSGLEEDTVIDIADRYPTALDLLSTRRYDLAVVDLALLGKPSSPEEADELGMDLLAEVRGGPLNPSCAVIVLTGYPSTGRFNRALREYNTFRFLLKSEFEKEEQDFLEVARSAIKSARGAEGQP